jgi:signal transduction histidine kinase
VTTPVFQPVVVFPLLMAAVVALLFWHIQQRQQRWHSQFAALMATSHDAILWLDRWGRVVSWNSSAIRLLKVTPQELNRCPIGKIFTSISEVKSSKTNKGLPAAIACLAALQRADTLAEDFDGNTFPVSVSLSELRGCGEIRYLVLLHDQSRSTMAQNELERYANQLLMTKKSLEQHNARLEASVALRTEELRQAKEEAEAASAAKTCFLSNMSHELRTPLHGILSFARFGLRRIDNSDRNQLLRYFENIENCGNTLLRLVNQLLDLAKLESGTTELNLTLVLLDELVKAVARELTGVADEKQVGLHIAGLDRAIEVEADRERMAQVVRNIVGNALKFSPPGGRIDIELFDDDHFAGLRVTDEGPGVPEAELETIFDAFAQSSHTTSGAGGTGLGLAICREIVTLHGGRIWAENVQPHGAAISFEISRRPVSAETAPAPSCSLGRHGERFHQPVAVLP